MRSGDVLRRDVLRMATSAAYNLEKQQRRPLTDDEVLAVLTREVKTRRESVEAFRVGGREELAAKEEAEIAILQAYLPGRWWTSCPPSSTRRSSRPGQDPRAISVGSWAGSPRGRAAAPTDGT
jgi:hypothetical protein